MKKFVLFFLITCMLLTNIVFADGSAIIINGEQAIISEEMGSVVQIDGRNFVPIRFVLEYFGYEVNWDEERQTVLGRNAEGNIFITQVGSNLLICMSEDGTNKKTIEMDVKPFLNYNEGRTYIPLRFIAEGLDYEVGYDEATNTVTLGK